jgi:hypothetical protein
MKKIKFIPKDLLTEKIIDPPKPASMFVPQWFKKLSPYIDEDIKSHRSKRRRVNLTAKTCMPIFDSISTGYMITLPCDVNFVDRNIYGHRANWEVSWNVVSSHGKEQVQGINLPDIYEEAPLKFEGMWRVIPPRGYSLLYTHPFYHYDLPFFTTTGIVDADQYGAVINLPFFIRKDFFGVLEKGTPIAQVIPIKRESWHSEVLKHDPDYQFASDNLRLKVFRSYKKRFWNRKNYT